jgi:hypothetical protein
MRTKITATILAFTSTTILPLLAIAQGTGGGGNPSPSGEALVNPLRFNSLTEVLFAIVDILLILAVPIIIFFIIYAGFLYVTAQGNPAKISEANRALLYAVIGGVIILGARVIASIVESTVDGFRAP